MVTVFLVCILNVNYFKAILWRIARNRTASAKKKLSFVLLSPTLPTLSFLPRNPCPTEIRYDRDPVSHRHRRLIPGATRTSSILSNSILSICRGYGKINLTAIAASLHCREKKKKNTQVSFSRAASSDIWSRENCNGLAISDQHETMKKRPPRFFFLLQTISLSHDSQRYERRNDYFFCPGFPPRATCGSFMTIYNCEYIYIQRPRSIESRPLRSRE